MGNENRPTRSPGENGLPLKPIEEVERQTVEDLGLLYGEVIDPGYVQKEQERRAKLSPLERAAANASFILERISPKVGELFARTRIGPVVVLPRTLKDIILENETIEYYGDHDIPWGLNADSIGHFQKMWDSNRRGSREMLTRFGNLDQGTIILKFVEHMAKKLR